jgi:hypothetical protein
MITNADIEGLDLLDASQKSLLKDLLIRDNAFVYNRRWVTRHEAIEINSQNTPDLAGQINFYLTNITSDAIIESVLIFKNGILLRSPYPSYGYPWIENFTNHEFTVQITSAIQFIPPMEIKLSLLAPLVQTDNITAIVNYRAHVPADYNFADAVADLLLSRKRDDRFLDRDFLLFKNVPPKNPELIPAGVPVVEKYEEVAIPVLPTVAPTDLNEKITAILEKVAFDKIEAEKLAAEEKSTVLVDTVVPTPVSTPVVAP